MNDTERVCLVFGGDEGFAMPMAVSLYSALVHLDRSLTAHVYILDSGITAESKKRLGRVALTASAAVRVEFARVDSSQLDGLRVTEDFTSSIYLRLLIPDIVARSFQKAIYLDADTLVRADLRLLWEHAMDGHALLAVQDIGSPYVASRLGLQNYARLGLHPETPYMNSGVLVFNLRLWREERLADQVFHYLRLNGRDVRWPDQDALNAILSKRWGKLDRRWNVLPQVFLPDTVLDEPWSLKEELEQERMDLCRDYRILHFACRWGKPWREDCRHPLRFVWIRILMQSKWFKGWEKGPWLTKWLVFAWCYPRRRRALELLVTGKVLICALLKRRAPRAHSALKRVVVAARGVFPPAVHAVSKRTTVERGGP